MAWITSVHKGAPFNIYFDAKDFERISDRKWTVSKQGSYKKPYAVSFTRGGHPRTKLWMHRVIMECPEGMVTDHRDGDGLNNCRGNLRIVTFLENAKFANNKRNKRPSEEPWL
jgi:hypothetical protein